MIDVSIAKYSEAIATSGDEMRYVLSWLHGNYDDKAGDTTINLPALGDTGTAIGKNVVKTQT